MQADGFDQVWRAVSRTDAATVATFRSEAALDVLARICRSGRSADESVGEERSRGRRGRERERDRE